MKITFKYIFYLLHLLSMLLVFGCSCHESRLKEKDIPRLGLHRLLNNYYSVEGGILEPVFYINNFGEIDEGNQNKVIELLLDIGYSGSFGYLDSLVPYANTNNEKGVPYIWYDDDSCKIYAMFVHKFSRLSIKLDEGYYLENLQKSKVLISDIDAFQDEDFGVWQLYLYFTLCLEDGSIDYVDVDKMILKLVSNHEIMEELDDFAEILLRINDPSAVRVFSDLVNFNFFNLRNDQNVFIKKILSHNTSYTSSVQFGSKLIELYLLYWDWENDPDILFGQHYGGGFRSEEHEKVYNDYLNYVTPVR